MLCCAMLYSAGNLRPVKCCIYIPRFFSSLYLFLFASQFVDSLYRWCTLFVVVIVVVVVVAGVVVVQYVSNANLNLIEKGD